MPEDPPPAPPPAAAPESEPRPEKKDKRKDKLRSAWISFAGRVVAQMLERNARPDVSQPLLADPVFDGLRSEPRFGALLRRDMNRPGESTGKDGA